MLHPEPDCIESGTLSRANATRLILFRYSKAGRHRIISRFIAVLLQKAAMA
tara:strand:+ start:148 stop:300 length:153 start_codon:yes stop_codon:yes gene_type:complete